MLRHFVATPYPGPPLGGMQAVAVDVSLGGLCVALSGMKSSDRVILKNVSDGYETRCTRQSRVCLPERRRDLMSTVDKAKNKVQEAKGDLEEAAGKATNDRSREAKGKRDKASGNLKQAGEKVKDAFRK